MFVGAICFTSSGSNGACWVVLVFHTRGTPTKTGLNQKKVLVRKENAGYVKKKYATHGKKTACPG